MKNFIIDNKYDYINNSFFLQFNLLQLEKALKIRPIFVFVLRKSEKCDKKIVMNGC
jgi:hypothetical protein